MSLFPEDLSDPWLENVPASPPAAGFTEPVPDYIEDLISQNDELVSAIDAVHKVSVPRLYTALFGSNIRKDGLADMPALEKVLESAGLNQLSMESVLGLVTMNGRLEFTTVNEDLWNVVLGLAALEQQELGSGSFANLEKLAQTLPELQIESSVKIEDQAVRKEFQVNSESGVTVAQMAEKEGLVFKHVNYLVTSSGKKVVRRYSDFVWLHEVLLKKYPYRLVPSLPPKRFSGPADDPLFLARRRRGLQRFLLMVLKHPVLQKEPMVTMFLTIPTDLSAWRKQAHPEIIEELEGKRILKKFIDSWDPAIESTWAAAEALVVDTQNWWAKIALLVERLEKRKQLYIGDSLKLVEAMRQFSVRTPKLYLIEPSDVGLINSGMESVAKHVRTLLLLLKDESQMAEEGILKDIREYNEYLTALYNLFERRKTLETFNMAAVKARIEGNQQRLAVLKKKTDVRPSEIDHLVGVINEDKETVLKMTNREWLVRECIWEEFLMFQETQYQISRVWAEWLGDRLKYDELQVENWSQLVDEMLQVPIE